MADTRVPGSCWGGIAGRVAGKSEGFCWQAMPPQPLAAGPPRNQERRTLEPSVVPAKLGQQERRDPMSYRVVAQAALERWREAESRKDEWPLDSDEWETAYLEGELAKADYQQAIDDAKREHKPLPPPFEDVRGL
jgi:hypothetical protein